MKRSLLFSSLALALFALMHNNNSLLARSESDESSSSKRSCDKCHRPEVTVICQRDIPATLKKSGEYELGENIKWDGSGSAITITGTNIKLNSEAFNITVTSSKGTAITVQDATEVTLNGDAIVNTSKNTPSGNGVFVSNSQDVTISRQFINGFFNGIQIDSSSDVRIIKDDIQNATQAGVFVTSSAAVTFNDSVFTDNGVGVQFASPLVADKKPKQAAVTVNQDFLMRNCIFPNSGVQGLLAQQVNGLIVESSLFTNTGTTNDTAVIQLGDADPAQQCNNASFTNCTFRSLVPKNTVPEGVLIVNANGFIFDTCLAEIDSTGQALKDDKSCYHIAPNNGTPPSMPTTGIFRNCVAGGRPHNGFYPDNVQTTGLIIDGCVATNGIKNGIFLAGTANSIVKNCLAVENNMNGILVDQVSSQNAIINNACINNGSDATSTQGRHGIAIDSQEFGLQPPKTPIIPGPSTDNLIQGNQTFGNKGFGIFDNGTRTRIFSNEAHANGNGLAGSNYTSTTSIIFTNTPGIATTAGANLDVHN